MQSLMLRDDQSRSSDDRQRPDRSRSDCPVLLSQRLVLRAPDLKTRVAKMMTQMDTEIDEAKVCIAMLQIDKIWDQLFPAEQERIVRLLIKKVVVTPHNIEVQFMPNGLERLAAELNLPAPKEAVVVAA